MTSILVSSSTNVNDSDNMDRICIKLLSAGFEVSHSVSPSKAGPINTRPFSCVADAADKFLAGKFAPDAVLATQPYSCSHSPLIVKALKDKIPLFIYKHYAVITKRCENIIASDNPWPFYAEAECVFCIGPSTRFYLLEVSTDIRNVQVVGMPKWSAFAAGLPSPPRLREPHMLAVLGCAPFLRPNQLEAALEMLAVAARHQGISVVYRPHPSEDDLPELRIKLPAGWKIDKEPEEFKLARRAAGVVTLTPSTALIPYWAQNIPAFYLPSCFEFPIFQRDYAEILRPLPIDKIVWALSERPDPAVTRDILSYFARLSGDPGERIADHITDFFAEKEAN